MTNVIVELHEKPLNLAAWEQRIGAQGSDDGAQVSFTGLVRSRDQTVALESLYIEHYPGVTEAEIRRIAEHAARQWRLSMVVVLHRTGTIAVQAPIVWVLTRSKHRLDAYAANEFIMDYLKVSAPFWKKECFQDGREKWVEARQSDQDRFSRWQQD